MVRTRVQIAFGAETRWQARMTKPNDPGVRDSVSVAGGGVVRSGRAPVLERSDGEDPQHIRGVATSCSFTACFAERLRANETGPMSPRFRRAKWAQLLQFAPVLFYHFGGASHKGPAAADVWSGVPSPKGTTGLVPHEADTEGTKPWISSHVRMTTIWGTHVGDTKGLLRRGQGQRSVHTRRSVFEPRTSRAGA